MAQVDIQYCHSETGCVFCDSMTSASLAQWVSIECDAALVAESVTISTDFPPHVPKFPTYICDVEIFGGNFISQNRFELKRS